MSNDIPFVTNSQFGSEPSFAGPTIDQILTTAYSHGASDIHVSAGAVVKERIDGSLTSMNDYPTTLTPSWTEDTMKGLMNNRQWETFNEHLEYDMSYTLAGIARFRVNVFWQRGTVGAVFRIIPTLIKTLDELGIPPIINELTKKPRGLILVTGPTGSGKALRLNTKLPTPTGWTTMGEVKVGDKLLDSKHRPTKVTGLSPINDTPDLYKVTLSDGQTIFADADHQWIVASHSTRNEPRHWKTLKVNKNTALGLKASKKLKKLALTHGEKSLTLKSALVILCDNDLNSYFPSHGSILASLRFMDVPLTGFKNKGFTFNGGEAFNALALRLNQRYDRPEKSVLMTMSTSEMIAAGLKTTGRANFSIPLVDSIKNQGIVSTESPIDPYLLGVWLGDGSSGAGLIASGYQDYNDLRNNKHIPMEFLRATFNQRLALLQGLMDTDGSVNKDGRGMGMGFSNETLAMDAFELVRSLGIKAKVHKKKAGYKNTGGVYIPCKDSYSIEFVTTLPVFRLERKLARVRDKVGESQKWLYIKAIEPVAATDVNYGPVRCLSVSSPDSSYLCEGFVVTHNSTTLAAMIDAINSTRADHIMTIEDPIEFVHTNKVALINQREVGSDTLNFAESLKRVLRQDPDVILVGELRDPETISIALTAAETGHLVFGTLHTQSAAKTINRIIDSFSPAQQSQVKAQLSVTLEAVVSQTLMKRVGGGRVAATEIMLRTNAIANMISEGQVAQLYSAIQTGSTFGMHTLDQDLQKLVGAGIVARDEATPFLSEASSLDGLSARAQDDWNQY